MQLMPGPRGLWASPIPSTRPRTSTPARCLAEQLRHFGSLDLALAPYNAGPGAVERYGGVPTFDETQRYVQAVKSYLGYTPSPPERAQSPPPPAAIREPQTMQTTFSSKYPVRPPTDWVDWTLDQKSLPLSAVPASLKGITFSSKYSLAPTAPPGLKGVTFAPKYPLTAPSDWLNGLPAQTAGEFLRWLLTQYL